MTDWRASALCAQIGDDLWFPPKGGAAPVTPKRVCAACPVRAECLEWAIEHRETWGIYGGLSATERRPLLRERYGGAVA